MTTRNYDPLTDLLESVQRFPEIPLDPSRVPQHLHPLLALIGRLGRAGQDAHDEMTQALSEREWVLLSELDAAWAIPIQKWLLGPEIENRPLGDTYMQIGNFSILQDDARTLASRRAREAGVPNK